MSRCSFFHALLVLWLAVAAPPTYAKQDIVSDSQLLGMAGDKYANGELPLGDQHYALDGPRKGSIYLCHTFGDGGGGAQHDGPWIHGNSWNMLQKPSVQGAVTWPNAEFSMTIDGGQRVLSGNGLPIDHTTGVFPIGRNDPASAYDRNPNTISPQNIHELLPVSPIYSDPPFCMGMEVGYMLDGVPLFNGFDAGLRDAAAHEVQDSCQAHPQRFGQYHYHSLSRCIKDVSEKTVIGYALDGFPITGPMMTASHYLTTDDLDECHGITSEIIQDGKAVVTYHYVMTMDFPYSASCFRAKPVRIGPAGSENGIRQNSPSRMNSNMGNNMSNGNFGNDPPRQPPAEALNACAGKNDGDACGFTSPRGDQITGSCHSPPQSGLACVPMGGGPSMTK